MNLQRDKTTKIKPTHKYPQVFKWLSFCFFFPCFVQARYKEIA